MVRTAAGIREAVEASMRAEGDAFSDKAIEIMTLVFSPPAEGNGGLTAAETSGG